MKVARELLTEGATLHRPTLLVPLVCSYSLVSSVPRHASFGVLGRHHLPLRKTRSMTRRFDLAPVLSCRVAPVTVVWRRALLYPGRLTVYR